MESRLNDLASGSMNRPVFILTCFGLAWDGKGWGRPIDTYLCRHTFSSQRSVARDWEGRQRAEKFHIGIDSFHAPTFLCCPLVEITCDSFSQLKEMRR